MKQVEVSILGQVYMLGCPEGGETLLASAVAGVDREMTAIRDAGKVRARERIAVLAALNLAYMLAERGPATAPAPTSTSAPPAAAPGPAADASELGADLDALLRRVDQVLSDDGRLL
jgi:cell division protein ZapA